MTASIVDTRWSGEVFELALYQTETLTDRNDIYPELAVANHVADSLTNLRVNYRIFYHLDRIPITNTDPSCGPGTQAIDEWRDYLENHTELFVAKDSNILLLHRNGGGCASTNGNVGVVGADRLDHYDGLDPVGQDSPWHGNLYSAMHEIGHNMGMTHARNGGRKWNQGGRHHRTPTNGQREEHTNLCGDLNPGRGSLPTTEHCFYTECDAENIKFAEDQGRLYISDLDIDPNPAFVGETVTITATMTNTHSDRRQKTEAVLVGDDQIGSLNFDVPGGGEQSRSIEYETESVGDFLVQVNQGVETLEVEEEPVDPGEIEVVDILLDHVPPVVDEPNEIIVVAENVGEATAEATFDVFVDGGVHGSVSFDIQGGRSDSVSIAWTPSAEGAVNIDVSGLRIVANVEAPGGGNGGGNGNGGEPPIESGLGALAAAGVAVAGLYLVWSRRRD